MEKHESIEIELIFFDSEDVILCSGGNGDIPLDPAQAGDFEDEI